jgi:hypothetical protein
MAFDIPPPPPPTEWTPDDDKNPGSTHQNPSGGTVTPPTAVDTPSLDNFATYVGELIPTVKALIPTLKLINVQPGAFYHADEIRNSINGLNGDAGLKGKFLQVVGDLAQALTDLQGAVNDMSTKYKNAEDLNNSSVSDLQNKFQSVQSDFNSLITDAGGSGSGS